MMPLVHAHCSVLSQLLTHDVSELQSLKGKHCSPTSSDLLELQYSAGECFFLHDHLTGWCMQ